MEYGEEYKSKYCYANTNVLINKFSIKDQSILDNVEADITRKNLTLLHVKPVKGEFDIKHLQAIHLAIFKDIYPFAGQIRNEVIYKGNSMFALPQYIYENLNELLKQLKKENYLLGTNLDEFAKRVAYYMAEINVIHPFREGNGRTNREFIRTLGIKCSYVIDWSKILKDELLEASIATFNDPKSPKLEMLIKRVIED